MWVFLAMHDKPAMTHLLSFFPSRWAFCNSSCLCIMHGSHASYLTHYCLQSQLSHPWSWKTYKSLKSHTALQWNIMNHDDADSICNFQEGEIERCSSCKSGFHKPCFRKIISCPCGQPLKQDGQKGVSTSVSLKIDDEMSSTVDFLGRKSDSNSTMRFLSGLFTKARQEKLSEPKDGNTTILMGSLPCTSLWLIACNCSVLFVF